MWKTTLPFIVACLLMAPQTYAGFNGNQGVSGNEGAGDGAGNNNVGVCINGNGQNAGQCVGESNGTAKPKEKERSETLKSVCSSPFMKKYAAICRQ
ncbi:MULTISPECIES: hypothetical protein [Serratia]|uniref:hypothetical protein n=1 Tax=Serratia TaxID=613 RepID=UPI000D48CEF3|nr:MULTISPECIES: hypothetical protein [Serratia]MDH2267790.1 hypothetical protein [Serratia marcescens]MDH2275767.1 hypothetical protein [Serratia marcescens]PTA78987.1 hypothetical protein C9411_05215 [Serratia sp. Nf2]